MKIKQNEKVLKFENITKEFPGTLALDDVNLHLKKGEVLGLVGKNGAGKTTLLKTLSGAINPTKGKITLEGQALRGSPRDIREKGISMVYQGLNLTLDLTIEENLFLGAEESKGGFLNVIDHKRQKERIQKFLSSLNVDLDLDLRKVVSDLSIDKRQIVAIVRAVFQGSKVIALDEPTSALSKEEIELLFEIVKEIKETMVSFIFVSHHLREVFEIADRIAVLRDGQLIDCVNTKDVDRKKLIRLMLGKEISKEKLRKNTYSKSQANHSATRTKLSVEKLSLAGSFSNVSFSLSKGEILGVAGLTGSGKTDLAETIFGILEPDHGNILLEGQDVNISSPIKALELGIGYLPRDRQNEGLFGEMCIGENVTIENLDKVSKFGVMNPKKKFQVATEAIENFDIKTTGFNQPVTSLSGGNQQKVLFARLFNAETDVLILNGPTRGVDVGSKQEIYDFIKEAVTTGKMEAVIVISSEVPEIVKLCDVAMTMKVGEVTGKLSGENLTRNNILDHIL